MPDFTKREPQVYSGSKSLIPNRDYFSTQMSIQEHAAKKAGLHYDIRLLVDNKALSFATRKGLPQEPGQKRLLVRQPDHVPDYMNWAGMIEKDQYGAGKVKVQEKRDVVLRTQNDKMRLTVPKGPNSGTYDLFQTDGDNWLIQKRKPLNGAWYDRPKYKDLSGGLDEILTEDDYHASEKYDGAHFFATLNKGGIALTSQRESVKGGQIRREDNFPHIRDIKVPKEFQGVTLRGEIYHPAGFNTLSGMANSLPNNAVRAQQEKGFARFIPFDVADPEKVESMSVAERKDYIKSLTEALSNSHIRYPEEKSSGESIKDFYNRITRNGGEGIVLQNVRTGEFIKKKSRMDYDLKISDFVEGSGKYKGNAIGAIVLTDGNGNEVGKVGTGMSDALRRDMYRNPKKYIGQLVKVQSDKPLVGKLRGPSFKGFTTDKNTADTL